MRCIPVFRAVVMALGLLLVVMASAWAGPDPGVVCRTEGAAEQRMANLIGDARASRGLGGYVVDRQLSRVARTHTADMIEKNALDHTSPAQLGRWTTNWTELTENIGKGTDADSLFETFMDSRPHRHRILSRRYNHVGVGMIADAQGQMWVTIIFESNENPGTSLPRPNC